MEEQSAINNAPNPKQNRLHGLAFLRIGLVEFGFVIIALLLLFGTLNYFNILSISNVFPQLSWLPRQTKLTSSDLARKGGYIHPQKTTTFKVGSLAPPPPNLSLNNASNSIPYTSAYNTTTAETLLTQYINDTLKPESISPKIETKQVSSDATNNIYKLWTSPTRGTDITANLSYGKDKPVNFNIFIKSPNTPEAMTTTLANSLLSSYFQSPSNVFACEGTKTIICEGFQTTTDGKKGYGIYVTNENNKSTTQLFSCFFPKESSKYESAKSCVGF